jgi:hypothetical protein
MKALEAALSGLSPSPGRLDRDRILFRAGQRASPRRWLWPCMSAALALLSVGLGTALLLRPPSVVERIVYVPADTESEREPGAVVEEAPSWLGESRYFQIRDDVLNRGLDALPQLEPLAPAAPSQAHPLLTPREH